MASITNEIKLPSRNELIEFSELMSQQAICIDCYKPKKFYPIFVDHKKRMKCKTNCREIYEELSKLFNLIIYTLLSRSRFVTDE